VVITRSRRLHLILVSAALLCTLGVLAFLRAGAWLVSEDPLHHARAIVVFGGKVPFRAMEAAKLYKEGWADEVWVTQGGLFSDDIALAKLGIEATPEYAYSRMVLERLGVPLSAIRILPGNNANTAQEVRRISTEVNQAHADCVILVTSSYHTRRVKALWNKQTRGRPQGIVRYTRDEPFDPKAWWRDSADAMAVAREWFGLLNAWTGFPIKSEH
jgi:uncharacterized SAM-binding protein YcdF (DUF218 family)